MVMRFPWGTMEMLWNHIAVVGYTIGNVLSALSCILKRVSFMFSESHLNKKKRSQLPSISP